MHISKKVVITSVVGFALMGGGVATAVAATAAANASPVHAKVVDAPEPGDTPDTTQAASDVPEPGDTPDSGQNTADVPEPGDTPDAGN